MMTVLLNGTEMPPSPYRGPVREVEVPVAILRETNRIAFRMRGWESTVIGTAAVVVED